MEEEGAHRTMHLLQDAAVTTETPRRLAQWGGLAAEELALSVEHHIQLLRRQLMQQEQKTQAATSQARTPHRLTHWHASSDTDICMD